MTLEKRTLQHRSLPTAPQTFFLPAANEPMLGNNGTIRFAEQQGYRAPRRMAAVMDHEIWLIFFGKLDKKYVDAIARSTNDIIILLNASPLVLI